MHVRLVARGALRWLASACLFICRRQHTSSNTRVDKETDGRTERGNGVDRRNRGRGGGERERGREGGGREEGGKEEGGEEEGGKREGKTERGRREGGPASPR